MKNRFWLCLMAAAMLLIGLCACAETEIVPGMLMTAGETFYDEEFDEAYREKYGDVPDGIVPGSDAWVEGPLSRSSVSVITFLDTLADAPEDAWDMSALGDRSVLAWAVRTGENDYTPLWIAAEGGVKANPDSSYLFAGYCQESMAIKFDGNFDSSTAVDMTGMFQDAQFNGEYTDFSQLDTSNATCMRDMFRNCNDNLASYGDGSKLDLSGLDTSKVADMSGMFRDCMEIEIDLSGFAAESLEHSEGMFAGCENLAALRLGEGFDLDALTPDAFEGCGDFEIVRAGGAPEE